MSLPARLRSLEILRLQEDGEDRFVLRDPEGYTDEELVLSEPALFVAAHLDGEHDLPAIREGFARRYGGKEPDEVEIETLVRRLAEAGMLEDDTFAELQEQLRDRFEEEAVRSPAHAGTSYPAEPEEAARTWDTFWKDAETLEEAGDRPEGTLRGMVAPHIDLRVGGPATALAYRTLAEAPAVETVVVLGTSHGCGYPAWIPLEKPYETPLGTVPVDEELLDAVVPAAAQDRGSRFYHRREHAIEFQAFMLAGLARRGRTLKMLPVLAGSLRAHEEGPPEEDPFLLALAGAVRERGERVVVLAAADLAHVGPRFGDADPLGEKHLGLLEQKDRQTLATVIAGDAGAFFEDVMDAGDPRRICGLAPIYGLLETLTGPLEGKVLAYEQANDPTGTVSYASVGLWG